MGINAASVPTLPASGAIQTPGQRGATDDIQELVQTTCLARNEFLQLRTADKVSDIQERNNAIRELRRMLCEVKNIKPNDDDTDGMNVAYITGLSKETMAYLENHPDLIPPGVELDGGKAYQEKLAKFSDYQRLSSPHATNAWIEFANFDPELEDVCGQVTEPGAYGDLVQKMELSIKRETAEAQSKIVGLQASLRAGEQALTLISSVNEKCADTFNKILGKPQ